MDMFIIVFHIFFSCHHLNKDSDKTNPTLDVEAPVCLRCSWCLCSTNTSRLRSSINVDERFLRLIDMMEGYKRTERYVYICIKHRLKVFPPQFALCLATVLKWGQNITPHNQTPKYARAPLSSIFNVCAHMYIYIYMYLLIMCIEEAS